MVGFAERCLNMRLQIIVVGSCEDKSNPCGVAFFANEMTRCLEAQDNYAVKSLRTHKSGWSFFNSIQLMHACMSRVDSILFANFNTRMYARSLLIRATLAIACLIRKTKVIVVMHEDLLASPLKLLLNLHILASYAIVVNRPKSHYGKLTQIVLEKKTIYQFKNPPMYYSNLTHTSIKAYNKARLNRIKSPKLCKVGLFGLISREKGFDQAFKLLEKDEGLIFSCFTDLAPSSDREIGYTTALQSNINANPSQIKLNGRLDLFNDQHIIEAASLDIALFPYRKDAGLWNTTLSLCHYLRIPIIATNSKEMLGWNQEESIYFIPDASEERLLDAIKQVKNSPQSRKLFQTNPQVLKSDPYLQFREIIRSLNS